MGTEPAYRRKLIEVDLPLDAINEQSARQNSTSWSGHPFTIHPWWARRTLASCSAVVFASLVDDPSSVPEEFPTEIAQKNERERLHNIVKQLVKWERTNESDPSNAELFANARWEVARAVARSKGETPPDRNDKSAVLDYLSKKALPIYDPFCGGGAIPIEAQRLGLRAVGSDLNPIAVLITKALIELPRQFQSRPPVNPDSDPIGITRGKGKNARRVPWRGTAGLADDIRYYGRWIRERALERIGDLFPAAKLSDGSEATVVAWLWARTVQCPNPACGVSMPLIRTFQISTKRGNQHWTRPIVDQVTKGVSFQVQDTANGVPTEGTAGGNASATCIACGIPVSAGHIKEQARDGKLNKVMTAVVAEGKGRRIFLSPTTEHISTAESVKAKQRPQQSMPDNPTLVSGRGFGITHWHELFTERQLTALATLSDLVSEVRQTVLLQGAETQYADALTTYLALTVGRTASGNCAFTRWRNAMHSIESPFGRQALPMVWDFPEANVFSNSTQNWLNQVEWVAKAVERIPANVNEGLTYQANAAATIEIDKGPVIVTDPPYYDNIDYADLSDFFYVWLRPILRDIHSDLFAGILTPKDEEMTAVTSRFKNPRQRFEGLMNQTLSLIKQHCSLNFRLQFFMLTNNKRKSGRGLISTGWEAMLTAVVSAGFEVVGTWPMRTEKVNRPNSLGTNALASSVVLVCRPRPETAANASRREFLNALDSELPKALDHLTSEGHIAPVDLAQAAIGPGMQIYSRYSRVETISGDQVTVREALAAINQAIANYDERQEGELDPPTRFCLDWLKQHSFNEGQYGEALTLAQAKNVSIEDELRDAHGLVNAQGGTVQLQPPGYFSADRMPSPGKMTAWEGCFRMAWNLDHEDGSIQGAASDGRRMGSDAESVERLARILYNHFDRIRDSRRAVLFNNLVTSWDEIQAEMSRPPQGQMAL